MNNVLRAVLIQRLAFDWRHRNRSEIESDVAGFTDEDVAKMLSEFGPVNRIGIVTREAEDDDRSQLVALLFNNYFGVSNEEEARRVALKEAKAVVDPLSDSEVTSVLESLRTTVPTMTRQQMIEQFRDEFHLTPEQVEQLLSHLTLKDLQEKAEELEAIGRVSRPEFNAAPHGRGDGEADGGVPECYGKPKRSEGKRKDRLHETTTSERELELEFQRSQKTKSKHFVKPSEAIRSVLRRNPTMGPKRIIDTLAGEGVQVKRNLVKKVRTNWRATVFADIRLFSDQYPDHIRKLFEAMREAVWNKECGFQFFFGKYRDLSILHEYFALPLFELLDEFEEMVVGGTTDEAEIEEWLNKLDEWKQQVRNVPRDLCDFFLNPWFPQILRTNPDYLEFNLWCLNRLGMPDGWWDRELEYALRSLIENDGDFDAYRRLQQEVLAEFDKVFDAVKMGMHESHPVFQYNTEAIRAMMGAGTGAGEADKMTLFEMFEFECRLRDFKV